MSLFNKKHLIDCYVYCAERETIYGANDDNKNTYTNMYSFSIIKPEHLNSKMLYDYDEDASKYKIGEYYDAKFNTKTGDFTIKRKEF
jgi:hypothetical protein